MNIKTLYTLLSSLSYRLPAVWRPPPADSNDLLYEPFVSPTTKSLIEEYTLFSLKATLDELVTLGLSTCLIFFTFTKG